MAYNEEIRTPGQGLIDTLSSNVRIEEANGRVVYTDQNGNVTRIDTGDSTIYSDGTVSTTITAAYLLQNDGTDDRLFFGDDDEL